MEKIARKCAAWISGGVAAYVVLHAIATWQRGYEAVGGEAFAIVVPIFAAVIAMADWKIQQ